MRVLRRNAVTEDFVGLFFKKYEEKCQKGGDQTYENLGASLAQ